MSEEAQKPERFGDFEVVGRLGAGGMATLYVARRADEPSPVPVAIKVVHQHLSADWEAMRWFIDEALISIRIRHPNVVRVDELG
ncbi:MAG: serine/threonine protein kinase, partial [Myxococcota bacterium]|nr:serine/threonine protein kinase [Myxococcota bacterium]